MIAPLALGYRSVGNASLLQAAAGDSGGCARQRSADICAALAGQVAKVSVNILHELVVGKCA